MRRLRRHATAALAIAALAVLTGCSAVTPYAVADHDAKMAFHEEAALEVLGTSVFEGIADTENFTSVGYSHAEIGSGENLHVKQETSVWGATYVSREVNTKQNGSIDTVHMAGADRTYFLFGDAYLPATKTPWIAVPSRDLTRSQDELCGLASVAYLCAISEAWTLTQETHGETMPVQIESNADGSRHVTSVVTFQALGDAGMFTMPDSLRSQLGDEVMEAFIPLHVWLDAEGVVTKVEANGSIDEKGETLEVQFGFEMTGTPTEADLPTDPATLDPKFVTQMSGEQFSAVMDAVAEIRATPDP